jgi:hypothetical protein
MADTPETTTKPAESFDVVLKLLTTLKEAIDVIDPVVMDEIKSLEVAHAGGVVVMLTMMAALLGDHVSILPAVPCLLIFLIGFGAIAFALWRRSSAGLAALEKLRKAVLESTLNIKSAGMTSQEVPMVLNPIMQLVEQPSSFNFPTVKKAVNLARGALVLGLVVGVITAVTTTK